MEKLYNMLFKYENVIYDTLSKYGKITIWYDMLFKYEKVIQCDMFLKCGKLYDILAQLFT